MQFIVFESKRESTKTKTWFESYFLFYFLFCIFSIFFWKGTINYTFFYICLCSSASNDAVITFDTRSIKEYFNKIQSNEHF